MYECTAVGRPLGGPSSFLQGHLVSALRLDRMARRTRGLSSGPPRRRCGHPPESPQTGAHTGASHPYLPTAVRRRPVQTSSAAALRRRGRASAARPAAPYARRASRLASPVLPGRDRRQQAASSAHSDGTHLAGRTAASSARQDRPRSSDACSAAPAGLAPRAGRAAPQCGASSARGEEAVARVRVPTSTALVWECPARHGTRGPRASPSRTARTCCSRVEGAGDPPVVGEAMRLPLCAWGRSR